METETRDPRSWRHIGTDSGLRNQMQRETEEIKVTGPARGRPESRGQKHIWGTCKLGVGALLSVLGAQPGRAVPETHPQKYQTAQARPSGWLSPCRKAGNYQPGEGRDNRHLRDDWGRQGGRCRNPGHGQGATYPSCCCSPSSPNRLPDVRCGGGHCD